MIDQGKFDQAVKLLKDSGAKTIVLIVNDGKYQSALMEGLGKDIAKCLYVSMKKEDEFAILAGMAVSSYLDDKERTSKQ